MEAYIFHVSKIIWLVSLVLIKLTFGVLLCYAIYNIYEYIYIHILVHCNIQNDRQVKNSGS